MSSGLFRRSAALALFIFAPAIAFAHAPMTSFGQPSPEIRSILSPAHWLILLGVSLWLGQHELKQWRMFTFVYAPLTGVALALSPTGWTMEVSQTVLLCIALAVASLVVWEKNIPAAAAGVLLGGAGLALGFDSGIEGPATSAVVRALVGTWSGLVAPVFLLSLIVSLGTKKPWLKVGIRVLGSWIIAISLLVLAFAVKK